MGYKTESTGNYIHLAPVCFPRRPGLARRLLLLALGLSIREHQRPDRDSFIEFDWDNVTPRGMAQCKINSPPLPKSDNDVFEYALPAEYNYQSLLHIPAFSNRKYAKDPKKPVLRPTQSGIEMRKIGQKKNFTEGDFARLRLLYDCSSEFSMYMAGQVHELLCFDREVWRG